MSAPVVTIAMPVFNAGATLSMAVQSVVNQSFEEWELIIIDDGSTDQALSQLGRRLDPRVRIVRSSQNRGLAVRLNEIIQATQTPFLARMDHDDFAHPDRLRAQVDYLRQKPEVDLLGTRCVTMNESGRVFGELPFAETHEAICRRPWLGFHLPHPTWMGRTEWFRRHRYAVPAPYACEDQELLLRASAHSRYHALPAALLSYRIRSTVPSKKLARTRRALLDVQARHFMSTGQPGQAALSILAYGARSLSDTLRPIAPRARSDMRAAETADLEAWQKIIDDAEASAL